MPITEKPISEIVRTGRNDLYEPVPGVTLDDVARRIHFDKDNVPMLYLAVAPCRSGTTAQLRIFANAGMDAHYQPLKAVLRGLMHGETPEFTIPSASEKPAVFIKETLGPYTQTESQFDPVQVLLQADYPADKIRLIVEMREPLSTFASWVENFSHDTSPDTLADNFITAVGTVQGIYERARKQGIEAVTFVYEAIRDNEPNDASESLLRKMGVSIDDGSEGQQSRIIFAEEPAMYDLPKFHKRFREEATLKYFPKSADAINTHVSSEQAKRLLSAKVHFFYDILRRNTEETLGIPISNNNELESYLLASSGDIVAF